LQGAWNKRSQNEPDQGAFYEPGAQAMNPLHYLFAAYTAIWIILAAYVYSIYSREKKLRAEIERIRQKLARRND
jgi:CcmD family protein